MRNTILLAAALLLATATFSPAAIISNFDHGTGTDEVDQYIGKLGDGWATTWTVGVANNGSQTPAVVNTNPLDGGGNYLSVSTSRTGTSAYSVATVRRRYEDFGDVDVDSLYTIRFDYRVDSSLGSSTATNSADNRYNIIGSRSSNSDTNSANTWIAAVYAGTSGTANNIPSGFSSTNVGRWIFLDNQGSIGSSTPAMSGMNFVDSQIELVVGNVYHFEIEVDQANKRYRPSISVVGGSQTYTAPSFLGFRNKTVDTPTPVASTFLQFHAFMTAESTSLAYSVDNISIVVPEPSALVLSCFISIGLGWIGARSR